MKEIYIQDLYSSLDEKDVELLCWLTKKRNHGGILFLDFVDSTGKIQGVAVKKDDIELYNKLKNIKSESAVRVLGKIESRKNNIDLLISDINLVAESTLNISPNPRNVEDPFNSMYVEQFGLHPSYYLKNPKVSSALRFKSMFKKNLSDYFWDAGFVQFEPPTFTLQTLYDDKSAYWVDVNGQKVTLSRCATFHLEPALLAYEKVFAITNSFSNENSRSDRHLSEYTHLKAELAWVDLDELIRLAGKMYYEVSKKTAYDCRNDIEILGLSDNIENRIEKINPRNSVMITYDDAVKILREHDIDFEYGKSLSTSDEKNITSYFDERFVWIRHVPCSAEGFPFKRKKDEPHLTVTCDLIASDGFGEILGTAEKITDYDELLGRMNEKGKTSENQLARYKDYLDLRKSGLPEHGGIGMGIERAVRYILNLPHVRYTRPFPILFGTNVNF